MKRHLALVFATCLAGVIACGGKSPSPNVLLIAVDTLRPDHLGCYGYARNTSPHIDDLARSGVLAEHALSQATWTTASFGTVMTSLYPTQHGADEMSKGIRSSVPTLAALLRDGGYATGAIVNAPLLKPTFGLDRGFDTYDSGPDRPRTAGETTGKALE